MAEADPNLVTQAVVKLAIEILDARKVVLFGSRSRGDHLERSDYDFAVLPSPHLLDQ